MNPLAKFVGALLIAIALIATLNPVIAGTVLALELLCLPLVGLSPTRLARILTPLSIGAILAGLSTALYGRVHGDIVLEWGLVVVSEGSLVMAMTVALRILAIGLPSVALLATVDATDLADSLAQLWRVPQRFVFGSLAAVRLLDVLIDDWRMLTIARRARGLGSGRGPLAALTRAFSQVFALFVLALRRGNALATAMDARGFGSEHTRTYARVAAWRRRDTGFITITACLAIGIVVASVILGSGVPGV